MSLINKYYKLIIPSIIVIISYLLLSHFLIIHKKTVAREEYKVFYSSNINGVIYNVEHGRAGVGIILQNRITYNFFPIVSWEFVQLAKRGDTVKKPAYSDTLVLITKDRDIHLFKFKKYDEKRDIFYEP